jgi:hypothetical protein
LRGRRDASTCIANCGIVGGRRAAVLRALRYVVARLAHVWEQPVGASRLAAHTLRDPVGDMVAWNEYAYAHGAQLVTGYPHGPVNPPMYGSLAGAAFWQCTDLCLHDWHNASRGSYFLGHKLPGWVRWVHLRDECRPALPAGWAHSAATREEWRRRGVHRPLARCTWPLCSAHARA